MKTTLLDVTRFKETFATPMRDVHGLTIGVIDIWPYVSAIPTEDLQGHAIVHGYVQHVYRNGNNTFDHVLVVTGTENVFIAVVVELARNIVLGHHLLDLNREYGLLPRE